MVREHLTLKNPERNSTPQTPGIPTLEAAEVNLCFRHSETVHYK